MICHLTSHFCSRINCPNIQGDEMFPIILLMVLTLIRPNTLLSLTSRKSFLFISLKIILVRRPSSEFYLFGLHIEMHLLPFCVFFMIRNSFGCEQCAPPPPHSLVMRRAQARMSLCTWSRHCGINSNVVIKQLTNRGYYGCMRSFEHFYHDNEIQFI